MTDPDGAEPNASEGSLGRIADVLGCPVADFGGPTRDPMDIKGASELLSLWVDMDDDADRARLLDFARNLGKA